MVSSLTSSPQRRKEHRLRFSHPSPSSYAAASATKPHERARRGPLNVDLCPSFFLDENLNAASGPRYWLVGLRPSTEEIGRRRIGDCTNHTHTRERERRHGQEKVAPLSRGHKEARNGEAGAKREPGEGGDKLERGWQAWRGGFNA